MRTRFDQFAKKMLAACLAQAGQVETEHETSAEPQAVDLWFVPSDRRGQTALRGKSNVLGAMARQPALIEPFHQTPGVEEILKCVGKQMSVHAELLRVHEGSPLPMLWIVSSGSPRRAIRQLHLRPLRRIAAGVYAAAPGFRLRLVVVSALPRTRRSLMLRLLGAGRSFVGALQELERLPRDAWEARVARPWLVRYQLEIKSLNPAERTAEEEAIMAAQNVYDEWEREVMERGKALGLDEGKALGLDEGKALGLDEGKALGLDEGKALGLDEGKRDLLLRQLGVRFVPLPPWVEQRVKEASAAELDTWAERVITAAAPEDIFTQ